MILYLLDRGLPRVRQSPHHTLVPMSPNLFPLNSSLKHLLTVRVIPLDFQLRTYGVDSV
jgi:hypothetical protein